MSNLKLTKNKGKTKMETEQMTNGKTLKKWKVSLTRYPEEYEVEATSESEAIEYAKEHFARDWGVWESEAEEIERGDF